MKGYKGFNKDMTCRGFQYEIGQTYETDENIKLCSRGFHFCKKMSDVHNYYSLQNDNHVFCEIEALGEIQEGEDKCVTNKIKIIRQLTKEEVFKLANEGRNNTGVANTGNRNTGNRNTGNRNTRNRNTGNCNTGDCNTGNCNTGDCNTGDCNKTDRSAGVFCTIEPKLIIFNNETDMTWEEWKSTRACDLLSNIQKSEWIYYEDMTEKEKQSHESAKTCNGYLKEYTRKEATKKWWKNLDKFDKKEIFSLPNFDLKIFNEIMEIKITKKEYNEVMSNG